MCDEYAKIQAQVDAGQCPVCQRHFGNKEKRQCALSHIRKSKEPMHAMWRTRWWHKMFPHGKYSIHPRDEDSLPQMIREAVAAVYGPDVASRVFSTPP